MPITLQTPKRKGRRIDTKTRDAWVSAVETLISDAETWAREEPNWTVARDEKEIIEDALGPYRVPTLKIEAEGWNELHLKPIARYSWLGDGQINFEGFPTLYSVRILRDNESGEWVIRTDSGIDWPLKWGREAFLDVGKRLIEAL